MSSISSLIDYYELTEKSLELQVSDRHLDEIAGSSCRQWKSLSSRLGVASIVVDDIDARPVCEGEKRRCFFFKWKALKGSNATYRRLLEGLLEISYQEDAESVCKLLNESDSQNIHTQQPISVSIPLLPRPHERSSDDTVVKFSTVDTLMHYLYNYAHEWETIGTALNFQADELNIIKRILTLTTPQQRLRELLYQWIQRGITTGQVPTMEGLYHALSSDLAGLGHVAYNIRNYMASSQERKIQLEWKVIIGLAYYAIAGIALVFALWNSYNITWIAVFIGLHMVISYFISLSWTKLFTVETCFIMNCMVTLLFLAIILLVALLYYL